MPDLTRLQRLLRHDAGPIASSGCVVLCVAASTGVRLALQPIVGQNLWFATYYPAVLFVCLVAGLGAGLSALILSAAVADYLFLPPSGMLSLEEPDLGAVAVFLFTGGIIVLTAAGLREALRRLDRATEIQLGLNRELQHRVNNNLAVVQALASQTIRSSPDPDQFYDSFRGRLIALSAAQKVLGSGAWNMCDFPALPEAALQPFAYDGRVAMEGPSCSIPSSACVPLVLALHELGTNAVKYGALSEPEGRVFLQWRVCDEQGARELVLQWSEFGGPPVRPPSRQGLGSKLLAPQSGLKDVRVEYAREGLCCTLVIEGAMAEPRPGARLTPSTVLASSPA